MKTNINIINSITDNFLDRGFQNVLFPFRCLQHMLFISRFSIEYNCIRPHRVSYYIVSLIGTLGFIIFHVKNLLTIEYDGFINLFLICSIKLNVIMLVIPFVYFYILNIVQREDHVQMILKIQKAFRLINYNQYKKSTIMNWFNILRHILAFIVSVSLTRNLQIAVYFYTMIYFDVNLTYGFSVIDLLRDGIISWISELENYSKLCLELDDGKYNDKLKKLFRAYTDLMEAFDIFKNIFKFTTLYQALDTFFRSLLYLQTFIELTKSGATQYGTYDVKLFKIIIILWIIRNLTFVSVFSIYCERFYMSVSDADTTCSRLLRSLQSTVEAKKLCKNVQRLNRAVFHKMSACHVFTIDGSLPQKFNSLMVEYTVVVLQFAMHNYG